MVAAIAEVVAAEGATNREVVGAATVASAVVAVTGLSAPSTDDGVHIDDELVCQVVSLVIAEV